MIKNLKDFEFKDKKVLVRCDFNVPLDGELNILDDFKIKETLPTIKYLIDKGAKVILMSHLDPESTKFVAPEFNLNKVAENLSGHLEMDIKKTEDCIGDKVAEAVNKLNGGEVLLLENLRFHKGETENTEQFAKKLAELGDIFINDAFAECHRSYASIVGIPKFLPHGAGLLLEKEIKNLTAVLENPKRPLLAIIGGGKVDTKAKFIEKISEVADEVIVSGPIQKEILQEKMNFKNSDKITAPLDDLDDLDISDKTVEMFLPKILNAKTIIWNGPFGRIEDENFKQGTLEIANAVMHSGAFSVVGGGSTVEFLNKEGIISKFGHVSTGGGAMLDFLSDGELPGIEALK